MTEAAGGGVGAAAASISIAKEPINAEEMDPPVAFSSMDDSAESGKKDESVEHLNKKNCRKGWKTRVSDSALYL